MADTLPDEPVDPQGVPLKEGSETVNPRAHKGAGYGRPIKPSKTPEPVRESMLGKTPPKNIDKATIIHAHRDPSIKPPKQYPAPFSLVKGEDGAEIWFGSLCYAITEAKFKRFNIDDTDINGLIEQSAIPQVQVFGASNIATTNDSHPLGWWGDVYGYWEANDDGEVSLFEIRGPSEPDGEEIGVLNENLEREITEGKYWVKIGNVPQTGDITQHIAGNIPWFVTIFKGEKESSSSEGSSDESEESSSSSSSSSSDDSSSGPSSGPSSGESSEGSSAPSSGPSSGESSSSGSSKDSAIVPVVWSSTGYTALFTLESPDVRFEDLFVDLRLHGRRTVYPVDPRFMSVIEQNTLRVVSVAGDLPYGVGAVIEGDKLVLNALSDARRRPNLVNVKVSAIRRGFRTMRFPERTQEQFDLNERRLDLNTFQES